MADRNIGRILLIVLAVIGAVALIVLLAMWLMMGTIMGGGMGMMDGQNTNCCSGWMMGGMYLLWGLVILGFAALVFLLTRRK